MFYKSQMVNTGSDCPVLICLQTSRGSLQNKSEIIISSFSQHDACLQLILQGAYLWWSTVSLILSMHFRSTSMHANHH